MRFKLMIDDKKQYLFDIRRIYSRKDYPDYPTLIRIVKGLVSAEDFIFSKMVVTSNADPKFRMEL